MKKFVEKTYVHLKELGHLTPIGFVIAFVHMIGSTVLILGAYPLGHYGIIPESITPYTQRISRTSRQIEWIGFISIPLMALASFVSVALCLLLNKSKKEKK